MPASGKVLEDSIRLSRIRKIKRTLYVVQAVMLIALAFILIFVFGDASISPVLYLPINSFIAVMVILLMLLCLESFFFRILEIRFARSSSARHLMAKNSIRRAILIAAVTGVLAALLTVPSLRGGIEDYGKTTVFVNPYSTQTGAPSFYSSDVFALASVTQVDLTAPRDVEIYLIEDSIYKQWAGNSQALTEWRLFKANVNNYQVMPDATTTILVPPSNNYVKYWLILNDMENKGTGATAVIEKQMNSIFTGIVSILLIAFLVANVAWVVYLLPIERKYSVGSIYK